MSRRALFVGAALWLAACGYRVEDDRSQAPVETTGEVARVAVLPFDTRSYRRGLEITLTRLVDDELRQRSPRAPADPDDADLLLTGTITFADERVIAEDIDDVVLESSALIIVEVEIRERASGELLGTYTMREREPFSSRVGRLRTFEQASLEAMRDLAERIVYLLEDYKPTGNPGPKEPHS